MLKYIFVEGFLDELFINRITELEKIIPRPKIIQYSQKKDEKIDSYIISLRSQNEAIMFIADDDTDHYESSSSRIYELKRRYPHLSDEIIFLAIPEIEGWYISGLTKKAAKTLKLRELPKCDTCTKEKFLSILPNRSDSTLIRSEILEYFDVKTASSNSSSFRRFLEELRKL